jgi:hypothetical protein
MNLKGACGARKAKSCSVIYSSEEAPVNNRVMQSARAMRNGGSGCMRMQSDLAFATWEAGWILERNRVQRQRLFSPPFFFASTMQQSHSYITALATTTTTITTATTAAVTIIPIAAP